MMMGLPSLQALDGAQASRIWLAAEATDMRCGFDRLAERVRAVIGQDPLSGHLFVFHRITCHCIGWKIFSNDRDLRSRGQRSRSGVAMSPTWWRPCMS